MKKHKFTSINVVPFIDVMLVLLAIVLTTASFINFQQLKVNLPTTKNQTDAQIDSPPLEIAINKQGKWFLKKQLINRKTAIAIIKKQLKAKQQILIQVDKKAPFESFITLIDLLKGAGLAKRSSLITETKL